MCACVSLSRSNTSVRMRDGKKIHHPEPMAVFVSAFFHGARVYSGFVVPASIGRTASAMTETKGRQRESKGKRGWTVCLCVCVLMGSNAGSSELKHDYWENKHITKGFLILY